MKIVSAICESGTVKPGDDGKNGSPSLKVKPDSHGLIPRMMVLRGCHAPERHMCSSWTTWLMILA